MVSKCIKTHCKRKKDDERPGTALFPIWRESDRSTRSRQAIGQPTPPADDAGAHGWCRGSRRIIAGYMDHTCRKDRCAAHSCASDYDAAAAATDGDAYQHTDGHTHQHTDGDGYLNSDAGGDCHTDCDTHCHADLYASDTRCADPHANRDTHSHADRDADGYTDTDRDTYADAQVDAITSQPGISGCNI